jgi:hypothetical protein
MLHAPPISSCYERSVLLQKALTALTLPSQQQQQQQQQTYPFARYETEFSHLFLLFCLSTFPSMPLSAVHLPALILS